MVEKIRGFQPQGPAIMKNDDKSNGETLSKADEALFYQLLETELGGVEVYTTALDCAINEDLREEWTQYLDQTRKHVEIATRLVMAVGLDPEAQSPARNPVHPIGEALVKAMKEAKESGDAGAAQRAACEAIVLAETKDPMNWELLGEIAGRFKGETGRMIHDAVKEVEDQEDEHLYHTKRIGTGALAAVPGPAGRAASPGGAEGRQDGDRRPARQEGVEGHAQDARGLLVALLQ